MKTSAQRTAAQLKRDEGHAERAKQVAVQLNDAIATCGRAGLQVEVKVWGKKGDIPVIDVFVARPL